MTAHVLVEHFGAQPSVLPVRGMFARLRVAGEALALPVQVHELGHDRPSPLASFGRPPSPDPAPPAHGVHAMNGHVVATAPGEFVIDSHLRVAPSTDRSRRRTLADATSIAVDLALPVVGAEAITRLSVRLDRTGDGDPDERRITAFGDTVVGPVGTWPLPTPYDDPWPADD
jgi:hypothetical protein